MVTRAEIDPQGQFSLRATARFGFGPNGGRPPSWSGAMRLAFAVDTGGYAVVVARREQDDGPVAVELLRARRTAEPRRGAALAERWRPFRTWALVLIRTAGDRGTPSAD